MKSSNIRKIADEVLPCQSSEHLPPNYIVLEPGTYEYTCPECGFKSIFKIPLYTCSTKWDNNTK